ncbi:MAG: DNA-processing protein DprA [Cyanobacteriota bacterium]
MDERKKIEAFYLLMNTPPVLNLEVLERLIKELENLAAFWELSSQNINKLKLPDKEKEKLIIKKETAQLDKIVKDITDLECSVKVYTDEDYPIRLKKYKYCPVMIFYKGNISLLDQNRVLAIIGTRKSSNYGELLVEDFVRSISKYKHPIVTGLALGIDQKVMQTSLKTENKCISILASGIDKITPKKNKEVLDQVVYNGGCYLTEFPPGVASYRSNYPIRSKLMAALATDIIIIEAPLGSGAILVANEAFRLSKNVFCPSSYNNDKNFWGSHELIESSKAVLVRNFEDVINYKTG